MEVRALAVPASGFRFGFSGSGFGSVDEVVDAAVRADGLGSTASRWPIFLGPCLR
jgi:hypothetical protein